MSIVPAPRELADFACATRPDWTRDELDGAIAVALMAWPWPRVGLTLARMVFDADSDPRDLIEASRSPLERRPTHALFQAGLAMAREAIERPDTTEDNNSEGMTPHETDD